MSITDELREYVGNFYLFRYKDVREKLNAIADKIDAEHQKAEDEWRAKDGQSWLHGYAECRAELMEGNEAIAASLEEAGWVRLPLDADGEVIHGGDMMVKPDSYDNRLFTVGGMTLYGDQWSVQGFAPTMLRHHHAPTVEDVLREFALAVCKDDALTIREGVVEEYAAKLRLAEDNSSLYEWERDE